ncbi:hypothetical protein ACQBAU_04025 [Propionibacteriaceae bacterium Y2011]|uniref:hypothetical protein n=1 Tax=Microlunatus sp. Y2014 TaxID=3418488 RepID=UPI003B479DED
MMTAAEVLQRHFGDLSPDEIDAELGAVPIPGSTPLTAAAVEHLVEHGGPEAAEALDQFSAAKTSRARTVASARTLRDLVDGTMELDEAARRLGVSRSRISHRIGDHSLYAVTVGHRRRIPTWQVTDDGDALPGLRHIVPAIPTDMHPLTVEAFMTLPNAELADRSPLDHLLAGGPPSAVGDLLTALGRW